MKKLFKILAMALTIAVIIIFTRPGLVIQKSDPNLSGVHTVQPNGANLFKAIIRLETTDGQFYCSGTVLDGQYAITAAHCVTNSVGNISNETISIYDVAGYPTNVNAKPAVIDKLRDVALIKGDFGNFEVAPIDFEGADVFLGMSMISCGFPSGDDLWCTELIHVGNRYFQYKTRGGPIFKGCSGGPVFSKATGRIIGVNSAVTADNVIVSPVIGFLRNVGF